MILQHLHFLHLVGRQILAGQRILASHQIHPLDVKLVDGFALVLNGPAGLHLQPRHLADDIGDGPILRLLEATHRVGQCISAFLDAFRRDGNFFQLEASGLHPDLLAILELSYWNADSLEPHKAGGNPLQPCRFLQLKGPVCTCDGKAEHLPVRAVSHHIGSGKRLAGIVHDNAGERFLSERQNR